MSQALLGVLQVLVSWRLYFKGSYCVCVPPSSPLVMTNQQQLCSMYPISLDLLVEKLVSLTVVHILYCAYYMCTVLCIVCTVCTVCTVCAVCTVFTVCTACTVCTVCAVCTMCTVCVVCSVCS